MSRITATPEAKRQPQSRAESSSLGSSASVGTTPSNINILTLQRAVGNRAVEHLLRSPTNLPLPVESALGTIQTKLAIAQPSDPFEQEADRIAEQVTQTPAPQSNQISKEPEAIGIQRLRTAKENSALDAQVDATTASSINAIRGEGQPLSQSVRDFFEPRLGHKFSHVRVHADTQAAESARAIQARAYTLQQNIVFAPGEYAPDSASGKKLLAHELTHVVQQEKGDHNTIYRQPQTGSSKRYPLTSSLPPLSLPGTGLILFPGALTPGLLGSQIPLPASLRLTNALSVGTGPTFVLDLSPKLLVGTILGNVNLQAGTTPGTPPGAAPTPENQANLSLINPIISFDPNKGKLRGTAVLSIPTQYPPTLVPPTTVDVEIESTELGAFNGKLGYGPLTADFTLTLRYDTARLERALSPAFAPTGGLTGFWIRLQTILRNTVPGIRLDNLADALQSLLRDVQIKTINVPGFVSRTINLIQSSIPPNADLTSLRTALSELGTEITNPGFDLSGNLRLGSLPISRFSAIAPTTRPLERPLLGAPTAFPLDSYAYGAIVAPPGSLFPFATPALGGTYSSFNATSGFSTTVGALPTLSPSAITAGEPLTKQFPVYAYWEISYVKRVSNNLDLGIRFTAQVATSDLVEGKPETDPNKVFDRMLQDYQSSQPGTVPPPPVPNVGLNVYGAFNLF